jgi:toxin ParE1/3/4
MPNGRCVAAEVIWRPEARNDLYQIYDWIADRADAATAFSYTSRIESFVERLSNFPNRGTPRFHLAAGLRTVTFERCIIIAYRADSQQVVISRLFHTARDSFMGPF